MSQRIPWSRVFVEGAVIVLSILLALGIEAWWDDRQERSAEIQLLVSLGDELRENEERLSGSRAFAGAMEAAAYAMLDAAARPVASQPSPDSVDALLATLTWWAGTEWVTATVDALVSSGDVALISDPALRARLASWVNHVDQVIAIENQEASTYHERWLPYLTRAGYITQFANLQRLRPGGTNPYSAFRTLPVVSPPMDHSTLLGDREFQNLVQLRHWDYQDLRSSYGYFATDLTEFLAHVEAELSRIAR